MKSFKLFAILFALMALPFLSNAQISAPISMVVNYVDNGYGPLSCTATNNTYSYPYTIANGTSHTYYGYPPTGVFNPTNYWMFLDISAGGITENSIDVQNDLETHTIGVDYGYHYVPKSPSGTAPVFTIRRNAPYNYTVTTWLIPF